MLEAQNILRLSKQKSAELNSVFSDLTLENIAWFSIAKATLEVLVSGELGLAADTLETGIYKHRCVVAASIHLVTDKMKEHPNLFLSSEPGITFITTFDVSKNGPLHMLAISDRKGRTGHLEIELDMIRRITFSHVPAALLPYRKRENKHSSRSREKLRD